MLNRFVRIAARFPKTFERIGGLVEKVNRIDSGQWKRHTVLGHRTYVGKSFRTLSWGEGKVCRIGNYCSIASEVTVFLGGDHRLDWVTTFPMFLVDKEIADQTQGHVASKGDVTIGNDVWIGHGATIIAGSTIGDGCVIGARAVVAGKVEPYSVVVGNPARTVRKRFAQPVIDRLLRVQWWNWDEQQIKRMIPLMVSTNIERFLEAAEQNNNTA